LCLRRPPSYVPEVGKRCSGLMPIVCPIRRQRRSITVTCLLEAQHPAGNVLLVEVVIPQRTTGSRPPAWTPRCWSSPAAENAPRASIKTCVHRAGLTPVLGADGHAAIVATACNKELYRVIDGDPRPQRGDTRGATSAAGSAMIGTPLDSAVMRRPHRIIQAGLQGPSPSPAAGRRHAASDDVGRIVADG
jgi:hypothetical protein